MMDAIFTESVREISDAVKGLASEHGSDVIDLSLLAIRVEATQSIFVGFLSMTLLFFFLYKTVPWVIRVYDECDMIPALFGWSVALFVLTLITVKKGLGIISIPNWAAALGYPEVLIATNILKSAGVL